MDLALDHASVFADPQAGCPRRRWIALSEGPLPEAIQRVDFHCGRDETEVIARLAQASGTHLLLASVEMHEHWGARAVDVAAFHETFRHGYVRSGASALFQATDYAATRSAGRLLSSDSSWGVNPQPRELTSSRDGSTMGPTTHWSFDVEFEATGNLPAVPPSPARSGVRVPEVEALIDDMAAGRHADAYERFSAEYRAAISLDHFRALVDGSPPFRGNGGVVDCAEPRRDAAGTIAAARCTVRGPSGRPWWVVLSFAPEGGALKVDSIRLEIRYAELRGSNGLYVSLRGVQPSVRTGTLHVEFESRAHGGRWIDDKAFDPGLEIVAELLGPDEQPIPRFSIHHRAKHDQGRLYEGDVWFRWVPGELPPGAYIVRLSVTDHVLPDTVTGEVYGFLLR